MNIVCVICSDLLIPSDDVFHTPCGHIFHYACLVQWLERSKTCPQCRERTTEHKIHRIYFNFSNNDTILEDATSLQNKIDNMTFQIKLRDENINNFKETNEKLKKQVTGLRQENKKIESEINSKNSAIHAYKDQIKFYKEQYLEIDVYKKENESLKKDIQNLKIVKNLVDNSINEIDELITTMNDTSTLKTYIAVLKREMNIMSGKSREMRDQYQRLRKEYTRILGENKSLAEEHLKKMKLEKQLLICETEKISLQTQLLKFTANECKNCICNKTPEEDESLKTDEEYNTTEESNVAINECVPKVEDTSKLNKNNSCVIIDVADSTKTIEKTKSQNSLSTGKHALKRQKSSNSLKVPSILVKKSRSNQLSQKNISGNGMSFDGFGGHAKYDKFPSPIRNLNIKKNRVDLKTKH